MTEIGSKAFSFCFCLRNVAFPPNAVVGDDVFIHREQQEKHNQQLEGQTVDFQRFVKKRFFTDLQRLFGGSEERI
jgi:hypothetical protein